MSDYARQHPLLVLIDGLRSLPSYFGMAIIFAFTGGSSIDQMLLFFGGAFVILLILNLVFSLLNWMFFYYRYDPGHIHIRQGILFKKERSIKRERIQSINVYTNILQRAAGLATLQIKTAGTDQTEVNLRALNLIEIESIRSQLKGEAAHETIDEDAPGSVRRLEGRDLWLAGATSGRFLVLFSVIAFIASQMFAYLPEELLERMVEDLLRTPLNVLLTVTVIIFLLSYIVSVAVFVVQYYGFRIERYEGRLELRWGIIKQNHITVGLHRIQAMSIKEGILRQPFGLCSLHIEVAGGGVEGGQEQVSLLHPLVRYRDIHTVLRETLPEYQLPETVAPLPDRARVRYLIRSLVPTAVVASLLWYGTLMNDIPLGGSAFLLLIPAFILALSRHANGGSSTDGQQLTLRFRNLNRYHLLVKRSHVQSVSVTANPFQRFRLLRTVKVAILSSPTAKTIQLKDVDSEEAERIWGWYSRAD